VSGAGFENDFSVICDPHRHPMTSANLNSARQLLLPCILLLLATGPMAQTARTAAQPELPSKLQYVSPLRAYKGYADQPVESWREANDRVRQIGGWRAYAREVQSGQPARDAALPADPHAGHHEGAKP